MFYTYVLESVSQPGQRYIGHTANLVRRVRVHNAGRVLATRGRRPWLVFLYLAFRTRERAATFERYLKTGSGHAFAKRHFWPPARQPRETGITRLSSVERS